jgi:protocatechuate 3,4-dioxygenase alpha subunit
MPLITPSQTIGPYFGLCMTQDITRAPLRPLKPLATPKLFADDVPGARIHVRGKVLPELEGGYVPCLIEFWQEGGFGRVDSGAENTFEIETILPKVDGPGQAPYLEYLLFSPALLVPRLGRIYFEDEPQNATDPVLSAVPQERRHTLIARKVGTDYEINITLRGGEDETVFFDY